MICKTALTLAIVMAGTLGLAAQAVHLPANSTWKMNVAQSDFDGAPAPKADMFTVVKDTDKMLTWHDTTVGADGKTTHMSWSGAPDGKMRPLNTKGDKASWDSAGAGHWAMADGRTMDQQLSLSSDGNTVTVNYSVKTRDGKELHQKTVYERSDMKKKTAAM